MLKKQKQKLIFTGKTIRTQIDIQSMFLLTKKSCLRINEEGIWENPKKIIRIILNESHRRQILGLLWEGDVIPKGGRGWSGWQGFHSYASNSSLITDCFINSCSGQIPSCFINSCLGQMDLKIPGKRPKN